jgi:hypothetical protein
VLLLLLLLCRENFVPSELRSEGRGTWVQYEASSGFQGLSNRPKILLPCLQTYPLDQEWIWEVQKMHMGGAEGAEGAPNVHNFEVKNPRAHRGRSQMSLERRQVA